MYASYARMVLVTNRSFEAMITELDEFYVPEKWTTINEVSTSCSSSLATTMVFRAFGLWTFHTLQGL
jgi:hypothetical protein